MWFRLYTDIVDNPKAQWLSGDDFKGCINVLCLAKENGGLLPSTKVIAFRLRMSEVEANHLIEALVSAELLDHTGEGITPHNWDKWQHRTCDLLRGDWPDIRLMVLERDEWQCQYCGAIANAVDHIIARSRGGKNGWENLVAACKPCNSRKGNRTPEEAGMRLINKEAA
jgi:hypothetical protein